MIHDHGDALYDRVQAAVLEVMTDRRNRRHCAECFTSTLAACFLEMGFGSTHRGFGRKAAQDWLVGALSQFTALVEGRLGYKISITLAIQDE